MADLELMYSMASFVITVFAVIVGTACCYTIATSNKQNFGHHKVDQMAGDEGDD